MITRMVSMLDRHVRRAPPRIFRSLKSVCWNSGELERVDMNFVEVLFRPDLNTTLDFPGKLIFSLLPRLRRLCYVRDERGDSDEAFGG